MSAGIKVYREGADRLNKACDFYYLRFLHLDNATRFGPGEQTIQLPTGATPLRFDIDEEVSTLWYLEEIGRD